MATFTSTGIDPEIQQRVLEFLNSALTASEIAGIEPQEGPIFDDPTKGYGNQVRDYDIGLTVAQRILDKRATLGAFGFTDLSQLSNIRGFGQDKFDDLIYSFGPAFFGQWIAPYNTQFPAGDAQFPAGTLFVAPHAALLHTERVLFISGHQPGVGDTTKSLLWDPSDEQNGQFELPINEPGNPLYCCGHSFLSDGTLLCVGGGGNYISSAKNTGWKFDPTTKEWTQTGKVVAGTLVPSLMAHSRWYPTVVTLGGGRNLIVSGLEGSLTSHVSEAEIYDENSEEFIPVTGPNSNRAFPETYPGLHLLPGGEIAFTRTGWAHFQLSDPGTKAVLFRFTATNEGEWVEITSPMNYNDRSKGMSVTLLSPNDSNGRVMVVGGGSPDSSGSHTAEILNTSTATPAWGNLTYIPAGNLPNKNRINVNAVLLPDGNVLVCGGISNKNSPCALYDPSTNSWSEMAKLKYARQYHSLALLLPSGKVMCTGGDSTDNTIQKTTIEIFSPPYLFRGDPPEISSVPDTVHHAHRFDIGMSQATEIGKVVFVRPMAVTHQTDSEQRVIQLKFSQSRNTLTAMAPNGNHPHPTAPRGYYMLFVLDTAGVPSVARFVFLH